MEQSLKAKILVVIPGVKLYEIIENQKKSVTTGELKVLHLKSENIYLLLIEGYSYSLSSELQTMRSTKNQYVFPNLNGFLGILIPEKTKETLLEDFEYVLRENTDFLVSRDRTLPEVPRTMTFDVSAAESIQNVSKTRKLSQLLETSGEHIKRGIMRAATMTSNQIRRGSEIIKEKIHRQKTLENIEDAKEENKKNKETKAVQKIDQPKEPESPALKGIKIVSSTALFLSKAAVVGAVGASKEIGKWVSSRFEQSETSKKLERSEAYQHAKIIGNAGISAAVTIYDGLEEALVILGRSGAEAAVDIAKEKYGEEGGKKTQKTVDVLSDVGLICREVGKITVKSTAALVKEMTNEKK